jgi:hypothetical protein
MNMQFLDYNFFRQNYLFSISTKKTSFVTDEIGNNDKNKILPTTFKGV